MLLKILSYIVLACMTLSSAFFFALACFIWLLTVTFDKRLVALHYFTCLWATSYLYLNPMWRVKRSGLQHIDRHKTYIIVSNHQSSLDILLSFALFIPFKWVSKAEMFRVPLIGWNMWLNRYIGLKRGDKHSIQKMLQQATHALEQGSSVFIFPEGSRTRDGQLRPFKLGAFHLAKHAQVEILPIAIKGTAAALPKSSLQLQGKHEMDITVLAPIPLEQIQQMSEIDLAQLARDKIAKTLTA